MINDNNFDQAGGDFSTNYQAKQITIYNNGINYEDAKKIAFDVFESNFIRLTEGAKAVAEQKVKEFIEAFLNKLYSLNPILSQQLGRPGMQASLFNAQKSYAVSENKESKDILIDFLIERLKTSNPSILQTAIDEAIVKVDKVSDFQLDLLSLYFVLFLKRQDFVDLNGLSMFFESEVFPFVNSLLLQEQTYAHLQYLGCAFLTNEEPVTFEQHLLKRFPLFFCRGFTKAQFSSFARYFTEEQQAKMLIPCHFDERLFQLGMSDYDGDLQLRLNSQLTDLGRIINLVRRDYRLSLKEVIKLIDNHINPEFVNLRLTFGKNFSRMTLTPVGIAIAIANYQKTLNIQVSYSEFIHETEGVYLSKNL